MRKSLLGGGRLASLVVIAVATAMGAAGCARTFSAEVRQPNPLEAANETLRESEPVIIVTGDMELEQPREPEPTQRVSLVRNKRYPLEDLMTACADYLAAKGRRLSFEWALIDGVNDRPRDATELARLCRRFHLPAHVNLIPLNPTPGYPTVGSTPQKVHEFRDRLVSLGVNVTVRRNRGTDIDAACGQLAAGRRVIVTRR